MNIKTKLWALLALIISVSSFAGSPTFLPEDVKAPLEPGRIFAGVTAMYAKPSESDIGLALDSWQYLAENENLITSRAKPFHMDQEWEGGFNMGYVFPNSRNDLEFSYFHLNNVEHVIHGPEGAYSFGAILFPDIAFIDPALLDIQANSRLKYNFNQYDLLLGHKFKELIGNFELITSFGLRYANLQHHLTFVSPGSAISKYSGIGPLMALDGRFNLWQSGFSIVGHLDGSVLDGTVESRSSVFFLPGSYYAFKVPDENRVVPTVRARLGADYGYTFSNQSVLDLELGFEAAEYINPFDIVQGSLLAFSVFPPGVTPKIAGIQSTNFSYQGPYATLSFSFDV